jgi:lysophospholipase L1-like esterase
VSLRRDAPLRRRVWPLAAALLLICLSGLKLAFASSAVPRPRLPRPGSAGPAMTIRRAAQQPLLALPGSRWVAAWGASPQPAATRNGSAVGFEDQTLRELVFTSLGGREVRVRFTNTFGTRPLAIDRAALGVVRSGASVRRGTNHRLTFSGAGSIVIPPGAEALSDPVTLAVKPLQRLAVSLYVPGPTGPATEHGLAAQTSFLATGDHAGDTAPGAFTGTTRSWFFLDAIDVIPTRATRGTIVALGDSITDGVGSTINANGRWPNDLARRLAARPGPTLSVIDEGIGGNRVLNDSICCGINAVARFQRDVVGQAGVREVILLEGVNDIGFSAHRGALSAPHTDVSAAEIIAGEEQIIAQARNAGFKIFGATLTPFKGAPYWTAAGEAKREAVNAWIRRSGAFDGVIDFAEILADPSDPLRLEPAYSSPDHLHPNSAGYRAMARAVNLEALIRDA